jgi:site-specific recombinase XerD
VESYREKLSYLFHFLGDVPIEGVTVHDLRRYMAHLWDRDLSPFTVAGRVRAFKRLFNFLEAEGAIEDNPARRIKTPSPKRGEPKGISWGDFTALLETTRAGEAIDLRDRAAIMLLFDTGCRVGGLCGLKVEDLDLELRRATVQEKGDETRPVFYRGVTVRALVDWLEVRPDDKGPWLFVSFKGQCERLTTGGVAKMLKRRGEGCEGPVNPHAFRHGFARYFLLSGGDLGTLSDILGHSDVSVTKRFYGIFTVDELQEKHDEHSPLARLEACENGEGW